jgi:hypothetical protein
MVETRKANRFHVNKSAAVGFVEPKYLCKVRNISITGAALEFSDPVRLLRLPERFALKIIDYDLNLRCRVVWRKPYKVGITFE